MIVSKSELVTGNWLRKEGVGVRMVLNTGQTIRAPNSGPHNSILHFTGVSLERKIKLTKVYKI